MVIKYKTNISRESKHKVEFLFAFCFFASPNPHLTELPFSYGRRKDGEFLLDFSVPMPAMKSKSLSFPKFSVKIYERKTKQAEYYMVLSVDL